MEVDTRRAMPRTRYQPALSKKLIGERLRAARDEKGISQTALAETLGTYQTVISAIERGARGVTVQQLIRLATAVGIPPGELLGEAAVAPAKNGSVVHDRRFVRRLEKIRKLSKRQQQALLMTIDTFLKGAGSE